MPDWLKAALAGAARLEADVLARFNHILVAAHNEQEHGGGQTAPTAVTAALLDNVQEVHDVVHGAAPAAEAAPETSVAGATSGQNPPAA